MALEGDLGAEGGGGRRDNEPGAHNKVLGTLFDWSWTNNEGEGRNVEVSNVQLCEPGG